MKNVTPTLTSRRFLSIDEASDLFGCSRDSIRRLIARGDLPAVRVGRLLRLEHRDVEQFISRNREQVG